MEDIREILQKQQMFFLRDITKNIAFRKSVLLALQRAIKHHEKDILKALQQDLNKSNFEGYMSEVGIVLEELRHIIKHMKAWSKRKKVKTLMMHFPSSSYVYKNPYGVVLIISPWNYPFQLSMLPLMGAIAAGNCVILKVSEYAIHTNKMMKVIIQEVFDEVHVRVVEGKKEVMQKVLAQKFDYIFFTGSTQMGRVVMEAAAKYITPITLELGGKSPCIVDETANIVLAAKRIVWGKFLNAGQTCVAPDYILVHKNVKERLIHQLRHYLHQSYGDDPISNEEYPRIIHERHLHRLQQLMHKQHIVFGGNVDIEKQKIAPCIIDDVCWEDAIMQEEIFGPLLPIISFDDIQNVWRQLRQKPKPLALYLYTTSAIIEHYAMHNLAFGGGCINDNVIHVTNRNLAFGGIGESGMGAYHGKKTFDTFTHEKGILKKSNWMDISFRYPPYRKKIKLLRKIMR
ncbi:MAG: aldehyde dehydrogenase [Breznakia sp.]